MGTLCLRVRSFLVFETRYASYSHIACPWLERGVAICGTNTLARLCSSKRLSLWLPIWDHAAGGSCEHYGVNGDVSFSAVLFSTDVEFNTCIIS